MSPPNKPALSSNILAYLEVLAIYSKLSEEAQETAREIEDQLDVLWYAMSPEETSTMRAYLSSIKE